MAEHPMEFGTPQREPRNMGAGVEWHVLPERRVHG